jgi:1-acyl-sn-glycerol-3-phosphate acyltransferase
VTRTEAAPAGLGRRSTVRYLVSRLAVAVITRAWLRLRVEGRDRLPAGPAIYCFSHLNWADPFILMATLPIRPRLSFFGPREEDMAIGGRNRVMGWTGAAIPYKPGKNDLLEATRRVGARIHAGGVVAIAGEGRIHVGEREVLPLNEGAAYFALRSGVPLVPIAINGSSWLRFGGRIRIRIGEPLEAAGRPNRFAVQALTDAVHEALLSMVADAPDLAVPGRPGRWLTGIFNEWPEGSREAAVAASGTITEPYRGPATGDDLPGQPGA